MKPKAIIFDYFGVISVPRHQIFFESKISDPTQLRRVYELRRQHDLGYISMDDYLQEVAQITQTSTEVILQELRDRWVVDERIIELITNELKKDCKISILSNATGDIRTFVPRELREGILDDILISAEVGLVKPNPEIFHLACERLGVAPELAVMVDDIEENIQGAKAAGLQTILHESFAQCERDLRELMART